MDEMFNRQNSGGGLHVSCYSNPSHLFLIQRFKKLARAKCQAYNSWVKMD